MSDQKTRAFDLARSGDMAGLRTWTDQMNAAGRSVEATEILEEITDAGFTIAFEAIRRSQ